MPLAFIEYIRRRDRWGRPVDPGYGVDEGDFGGGPDQGFNPDYPDQGFNPDYPDQGFNPDYPDQGLPGGGYPGRPGHLPARPGRPGYGGRPTDPGWGVDEGAGAGHLPIWPIGPEHGLPPIPGQGLPPVNPPPGTIWPPLPPSIPPGKVLVAVFISGVGRRWVVLEIKPPAPGQGLPANPAAPGQGLPGDPAREPKRV